MKSRLMCMMICLLAIGCSANYRYPGWEYVRIEDRAPDGCAYKMQETCTQPGMRCYNWFKQRATTFDANTVVISDISKDERADASGFTGDYRRIVEGSMIAEYYHCTGPKNIAPSLR